ncbi:MAG: hypothetical protein ACR2HR_05015 [Euzebya sp.]
MPSVVDLSPDAIAALGIELDDIYQTVYEDLGADDEAYIRGLIKTQRAMAVGSRAALTAAGWLRFLGKTDRSRRVSLALGGAGMVTLGLAKILENMEIGHNVLHHTWTNVLGMDRDIGYEIFRIIKEQPWHPVYIA